MVECLLAKEKVAGSNPVRRSMPKKTTVKKRLYKSDENRVLSGVLGGIGEYFDVDPVLIRVLFVLASGFTGFAPGIVSYLVMALVIPEKK